MNRIICLIDNGDFLFSRMVMIFVLLSDFLDWIIRLILIFRINLLKIVLSSGLFGVNVGIWCNNEVLMDIVIMLSNVDNVNVLLICLYFKIRNGKLSKVRKIFSGRCVSFDIIIEIFVILLLIMLLGIRNILSDMVISVVLIKIIIICCRSFSVNIEFFIF